jgi:hypothetical protein
MKRHIISVALAAALLVTASVSYGLEMVTMERAERIASNWISLVIHHEGAWGEASDASIREVTEYRPDERLLGYCCHVEPQGYIIVSLYEGLAPVKAFSMTCGLNQDVGGSIAEVLRIKLECIHETIEEHLGPIEEASADGLRALAETDYAPAWRALDQAPSRFKAGLESEAILSNYQSGDNLLTSSWTQGHPYNVYCPTPGDVDDDDCESAHCTVGCVALAGAMLMRYWCWPPGYDWNSMPDRLTDSSPGYEINAVATLCSDIGEAVGMDYCGGEGCASSVDTDEMLPVYAFFYGYSSSCAKIEREDYSQGEWFDEVRLQVNQNRPIQYRIGGHSLVADGWKTGGGVRFYHLNMGWDGGKPDKDCWKPYEGINTNTWYAVDHIPCSILDFEYMLVNIYPITATHSVLLGTYPRDADLRYTYIDVDAAGDAVVFHPAHDVQVVRGISVRCIGDNGILFYGLPDLGPLRMFTKAKFTRGIRVDRGGILLRRNGCLKLY